MSPTLKTKRPQTLRIHEQKERCSTLAKHEQFENTEVKEF